MLVAPKIRIKIDIKLKNEGQAQLELMLPQKAKGRLDCVKITNCYTRFIVKPNDYEVSLGPAYYKQYGNVLLSARHEVICLLSTDYPSISSQRYKILSVNFRLAASVSQF